MTADEHAHAFNAGSDARLAGLPREWCPYNRDDEPGPWAAWVQGWRDVESAWGLWVPRWRRVPPLRPVRDVA